MMKKLLAALLGSAMVLSLAACAAPAAQAEAPASEAVAAEAAAEPAKEVKVGALWYQFSDTFISNTRMSLENLFNTNKAITYKDADSQNDATIQASNMNNFITQGVNYMVINNLNTSGISDICKTCADNGITTIFANTDSPSDEDFAAYPNTYSISSEAPASGTIMGEAAVRYWNEHPEADRNGNGKMDYIMLLGFDWHYDTQVRSEYSIKAITDAGIEVNCLGGEQICDYARATAQEKVAALLANYGDDVDLVVACNDDMALGAIEALKASGFFTGDKFAMVCSVDATAAGQEAVGNGTLLVTALNNPVKLAKSIYQVIALTSEGKEVTTESLGIDGVYVDGHRVWISYIEINKDNLAEASYDVNDITIG